MDCFWRGGMKIVGLTGGIACGKSTVSACLRDTHGLPLVDADAIAKAALDVGAPAYHKVIVAFGDRILEPEGAPAGPSSDAAGAVCVPTAGRPIDRKKLGEIVFNDAAQRRKLNGIISPHIAKGMAWECLKHFAFGTPVLVLDVPLLYETVSRPFALCPLICVSIPHAARGVTPLCHRHIIWEGAVRAQGVHRVCSEVVVVSVSPATQLARLTRRDGSTEQEATSRIEAQMPLADKVQRADVIIDNDSTEATLKDNVAQYGVSFNFNASVRPCVSAWHSR
jgi:dephospho-CoA kinase